MNRKHVATTLVALALASAYAGGGLTEGRRDFTAMQTMEEGYWYSRYNLGNLVMRSGLGLTFAPPKEAVMKMIRAVDTDPSDGDTVSVPPGVTLLKAVFKSGDPRYTQPINVRDFATQGWDPATFERVVGASAMGWTMMKEIEWAKQFHVDFHFGRPSDGFGAQWRFVGMVMSASAQRQGAYVIQEMMDEDGRVVDSDGRIDWPGNWVVLEALSNLKGLLSADAMRLSETNRYRNPARAQMFGRAADRLFATLGARQPEGIPERSLAIQALTWYAANTPERAREAGLRLRTLALQLIGAPTRGAGEKAYALRGLIEAWRVSGDPLFLRAAARTYGDLAASYNFPQGRFNGELSHSIDDVAAIMGALNATRLFLGDAVNQAQARSFFVNFFESAVNRSGLQQSVPPVGVAKGAFEQSEPPIFYGYPTLPKPPMAGGRYGTAPVFATRIAWNAKASAFEVDDARFESAGAMHASNEFIWFHNEEVNGFPEVK